MRSRVLRLYYHVAVCPMPPKSPHNFVRLPFAHHQREHIFYFKMGDLEVNRRFTFAKYDAPIPTFVVSSQSASGDHLRIWGASHIFVLRLLVFFICVWLCAVLHVISYYQSLYPRFPPFSSVHGQRSVLIIPDHLHLK